MSLIESPSFKVACQNLDICNQSIDDSLIADRIRKGCSAYSYSSLEVRSILHQFTTVPTQTQIPSRMIRFTTTNLQTAQHIFGIIFQKIEIETLSLNRVALGVLGSKNPKDQAELRSAYQQNFTIRLIIAMDTSYNYDISVGQGAITEQVALTFGKQKDTSEASSAVPKASGWCSIL